MPGNAPDVAPAALPARARLIIVDRLLTNAWYLADMAQNTSISLDDHFTEFLAREVASGRYRSASEVIRAALRLLEDQETHLAALRAALIEGEQSGEPEDFDFDAFMAARTS